MIEVYIKKETNEKPKPFISFLRDNTGVILTTIVALLAVYVSYLQSQSFKDQAVAQIQISKNAAHNDSLKVANELNMKREELNLKTIEYADSKKQNLVKFLNDNESKFSSEDLRVREHINTTFMILYGDDSRIDVINILSKFSKSKITESSKIAQSNIKILQKNIDTIRNYRLSTLYKPLVDHLNAGKTLYAAYKNSNFSYTTAKAVNDNDLNMLNLISTQSNLIPDYLKADAQALQEHLSAWTSEFARMDREQNHTTEGFRIIYDGRTFPDLSAQHFRDEYSRLGGK
jgi:hypothetical protein